MAASGRLFTTLAFGHDCRRDAAPSHLRPGDKGCGRAMPAADFQMPADCPRWALRRVREHRIPRLANEQQSDVWVLDLPEAGSRSATDTQFTSPTRPSSPDGKWLAFTSNESAPPEVYIQAFQCEGCSECNRERYLVSRAGLWLCAAARRQGAVLSRIRWTSQRRTS